MTQTSRLVLEIDSRDAESKASDVRKALGALEDAGLRVKPAMDKAGSGLDGLSSSSDKAKKSVQDQRDELDRLLGSINPLTRKLNELEKQELALAKAHKSGKIETDTYKEYQAELTKTRNALTGVGVDMGKAGISAKQMANNLRGVPAQFTDIAVSLQSGQAPLTVLLQQGGQLKDMFGGIGPASKALGGYVAGLVNPFSLAAAAVGALGLAYYQGSKEADAYNSALITTGNAAGTTSSALGEMAKRVGGTVGTTSGAAEALALLAGNGKIASDNFEEIATAAVSFEKATGKAVADTVAEFAKLADDPTKAVAALNEKYNFLTASVYEQIRAAQQMGEKDAAAAIAQDALASALQARSAAMTANLGDIERAWRGIVGAAKEGWDAMLGVGRQQSLDDQIANTQKILDGRKTGFLADMFPDSIGSGSDSSKFLEQKLAILIKQRDTLTEQGKVEGDNARIQREGLAAYEEREKNKEANFTKEQKRNKALEDELKRINAARSAGYTITQQDEAASLKAIRENSAYKESAPKKEKAYTEDAGMKAFDQARQQFAVLQQQNALIGVQNGEVDKLGASGQALVKWEQQLADIKTKQTLTADQQSLIANQELITAQLKRNAGLERETELRKTATEEISKLAAFQANQDSRLATAQDGLDSKIAGIGLGDQARDRLKQDLDIQKDYARQSAALLEQRNTGKISPDLYTKENAILSEGLAARLVKQQDYYNQENAARGNWLAGSSSSWQNYLDIATNYGQQARDATANLLGDTTSSISDQISGLVRGTVELGDAFANLGSTMASSVLGALSDIAAQWIVVHGLKMAGITAETGLVVASEGIKTTAKVTGDAIGVGSTLTSLAVTTAASVTAAATTMASWLPTALVASIGTFGAAAVVGGAGLLAAFALIKGFSDGGYTGAGGVNEPAGMVHKGEVVWSQADIRRSGGVASVESLRKGNVSPMKGTASGAKLAQANSAAASKPATVVGNTTVNLIEDASRAGQQRTRLTDDQTQQVIDVWISKLHSDDDVMQSLTDKTGIQGVGR